MSETTTATAANKAAKAAASPSAAAAVSSTLPTVVETVEVAMEVPAKVVLNQRLIVIAAVVGGAALGAGVLFGVQKFCGRNKTVIVVPDTVDGSTNKDAS